MNITDYQILILILLFIMNLVCACLVIFVCYSLIRFKEFREKLSEAIQDGDKIFHWIDAKSFGYFIAGWLCAWWTMNLGGVLAYSKMFEIGSIGFLGIFVAATFTLWGIAWRK